MSGDLIIMLLISMAIRIMPLFQTDHYSQAVTFRFLYMKFYVNGNLMSSLTIRFDKLNMCSNGQFILGDWWSGGHEYFNGKMNQIRIYTRALSANEVRYLFDNKQLY